VYGHGLLALQFQAKLLSELFNEEPLYVPAVPGNGCGRREDGQAGKENVGVA
jgi:hypothetical protein